MLPIPELVRFGALLDDGWRTPEADTAAELWGLDRPLFLRSSASHVVVARRPAGEGQRVVLRLRPAGRAADAALGRCAAVARALHAAGAPVADAVPSLAGRLVERAGRHSVVALTAVEGDPLDEDHLDGATAERWGAVLARLHEAGPAAAGLPALPHTSDPLDDGDLARGLRAELDRLPRDPKVHGLLHGDPEPDNVVVGPGGPVLVDLDDARTGWFASDVAFALREWAADGPVTGPDLDHEVPGAFVRGYRSVRPLGDEELGWLPLLARVAAYEDWRDLQPHLRVPPDPSWPDWARALDVKIRSRAADLQAALSS